jgi:hypothetical protein
VPEQLTVRVEAGRSPAAETDLVVNIIEHDRLTGQGPLLGPLVATQKPEITNNRQFRRIVVSVCPGSCTDIRRSLRFNLPGIPRSGFFILFFRIVCMSLPIFIGG